MPLHRKLLLFFIVSSMILFVSSTLVTNRIAESADERNRNQTLSQLETAIEHLAERLDTLDESLRGIAVSSDANLMSRYDIERNIGEVVEKSKVLFSMAYTLKVCSPTVDRIYIQFPSLDRQVTSDLRWDKLDRQMYETLCGAKGRLTLTDGKLYISRDLSIGGILHTESIVGCLVSPDMLMGGILSGYGSPLDVQLLLGDTAISVRGEESWDRSLTTGVWERRAHGYCISLPIVLETLEGNLRLEAYIPDSYSTVARLNIYVWIAVEFILMLLELFLFLVMVRKTVHKPIQKLLCAFDRLSGGDTTVCISHDGNNEFTRLYTHFNRMVAQLNDLFTRRHQAELAARNAELKHLQQQIHPHFLYNSFYQLYALCQMEGCDEAAEYALQLSRYYQYITRDFSEQGTVLLDMEYEHTRQYVYIQCVRYCNRLTVRFDELSEEMKRFVVPKLILQPIVENSIKHCLEKRQSEGAISVDIHAERRDDELRIIVEDNGDELSDEEIARLQRRLDTATPSGENSGMTNVHLRLSMRDEGGGITLSRGERGGLRVTLRLGHQAPCSKTV